MRILSRLPDNRGTAPLFGSPLRRSRRLHVHPEVARPHVDRAPESEPTPDPLGPARGIGLALGVGAIGWVLILSAIL